MPRLKRRRTAPEWAAGAGVALGHLPSEVVELRLRITRQMAAGLEAGVPCREVRIERISDDQVALLLLASNREQWLLHVVAHAERAPQN